MGIYKPKKKTFLGLSVLAQLIGFIVMLLAITSNLRISQLRFDDLLPALQAILDKGGNLYNTPLDPGQGGSYFGSDSTLADNPASTFLESNLPRSTTLRVVNSPKEAKLP